MLSCKEISELVSQSLDQPLPWSKRVRVRLHLAMCGLCRGYRNTILSLRENIRKTRPEPGEDGLDPGLRLPPAARERIRRRLRQQS